MWRSIGILVPVLLVACSSGSLPISPGSPPARQLAELPEPYKALQGVWVVTRARLGSISTPERIGSEMHFEGNRFWFGGDSGFEIVDIDSTAKPSRIDFWESGSAVQGIYRIAGSTLTLCSSPPGSSRPKDLDRCDHPRYILVDAQRKPEAP